MEGGEIEWRDENEMPVLSIDDARNVFRDVVSGLDYRKFFFFFFLLSVYLYYIYMYML